MEFCCSIYNIIVKLIIYVDLSGMKMLYEDILYWQQIIVVTINISLVKKKKDRMNPPCSLSSQLRGPVAPYTPVFLDGWKPEALRADGQVWEDPVESQHKHEALRVQQEVRNTCVGNGFDTLLHCVSEEKSTRNMSE